LTPPGLEGTYYESDLSTALGRKTATTCSWLTDHKYFQQWRNSESESPFLWIRGGPGTGKTILMASAIHHLEEFLESQADTDLSPPLLYFLCNNKGNDPQRTQVEAIFRSLLFQLWQLTEKGPTISSWEEAFNASGGPHACDLDQMRQLLHDVINNFPMLYVSIDAIDESSDPQQLVEELRQLTERTKVTVKILFSSRPLEESLTEVESIPNDIPTIEVSRNETTKDLDCYVRTQVERTFKNWRIDNKMRMKIISTLIEKADGMYNDPVIHSSNKPDANFLYIGFSGFHFKLKRLLEVKFEPKSPSNSHWPHCQWG
jgi:hypothetical protein